MISMTEQDLATIEKIIKKIHPETKNGFYGKITIEFSGYLNTKTMEVYLKFPDKWRDREEARSILGKETDRIYDHLEKSLLSYYFFLKDSPVIVPELKM